VNVNDRKMGMFALIKY